MLMYETKRESFNPKLIQNYRQRRGLSGPSQLNFMEDKALTMLYWDVETNIIHEKRGEGEILATIN